MHGTASERPQLHVTALNMLARCGEAFRRRYLEGEIIPPGVAAIVGTAVDRAVTLNLERVTRAEPLLPVEAVQEAARDGLEAAWADGVALDVEEVAEGVTAIRGRALDKAVRLARLHAEEVAPRLRPTHVQRRFVIELPGYPLDLAGAIDVVEAEAIRDTKTSAKTPAADVAERSDQLTMYALASKVLDGRAPERVALDYLVDLKTPKAATFESTRSSGDFAPLLRRVEAAALAIERGVFFPAPADSWQCSRRWCGYFDSCPYVRRPVQIAAARPATDPAPETPNSTKE